MAEQRPRTQSALEEYRSFLGEEAVGRIRRWHEAAYRQGQAEGATGQTFDYLGLTLVVPPGVMPITGMSHLLGLAVAAETCPGDRVLDMGTGCGVNALVAAARNARVVAVDISPLAVNAARANAETNGLADRVEVLCGDVFDRVDGVFDLMVFDPPFRWFRPRDLFEAATADEDYRALRAFFRDARTHLAVGGRMLVFFGSSGDIDYLHRLIDEAGFDREIIARDSTVKDDERVGYFTFRLTPGRP